MILILIIVDNGLVLATSEEFEFLDRVLILIVVDNGLVRIR